MYRSADLLMAGSMQKKRYQSDILVLVAACWEGYFGMETEARIRIGLLLGEKCYVDSLFTSLALILHAKTRACGACLDRLENDAWMPADGISAANWKERRLRYVAVFWTAHGQNTAWPYMATWGAGRKEQ